MHVEFYKFQRRIQLLDAVGKGLEPARDLDAISAPHGLYGDSLKLRISVCGDIDMVVPCYIARGTVAEQRKRACTRVSQ